MRINLFVLVLLMLLGVTPIVGQYASRQEWLNERRQPWKLLTETSDKTQFSYHTRRVTKTKSGLIRFWLKSVSWLDIFEEKILGEKDPAKPEGWWLIEANCTNSELRVAERWGTKHTSIPNPSKLMRTAPPDTDLDRMLSHVCKFYRFF